MARPGLPKIDGSCLKHPIDALAAMAVDVTPNAAVRHLHNGMDTPLSPADLYGSDGNSRPVPTGGIADRHAYFVGCGIGGPERALAAFVGLLRGEACGKRVVKLAKSDTAIF